MAATTSVAYVLFCVNQPQQHCSTLGGKAVTWTRALPLPAYEPEAAVRPAGKTCPPAALYATTLVRRERAHWRHESSQQAGLAL